MILRHLRPSLNRYKPVTTCSINRLTNKTKNHDLFGFSAAPPPPTAERIRALHTSSVLGRVSDLTTKTSTSDKAKPVAGNADMSDFEYVQKMTPEGYEFPTHRLNTCEPGRTPLILVACGSFSPITLLHLRLFPMARDHARNEGFDVVGAYLSPVGDGYKKQGLAPAYHRINMCEIAAENASKFLMVDRWEPENPTYIPTARVLDHFDWEINHVRGGVECSDGTRQRAKIALLAGADLIETINKPGVWDAVDVEHILGDFGVFVLERTGTELEQALKDLQKWRSNIHVIRQMVTNDISSTKVRLLIKRDMSIDYLIPDDVIAYIQSQDLYRDQDFTDPKGKAVEAPTTM